MHLPCAQVPLRVRAAQTFASRALGLLVGKPLEANEALLIEPCSSIHTFGMRYAIDVVFLRRDRRIVRIFSNVGPGRVRWAFGAHAALELRAGAAARYQLKVGAPLA